MPRHSLGKHIKDEKMLLISTPLLFNGFTYKVRCPESEFCQKCVKERGLMGCNRENTDRKEFIMQKWEYLTVQLANFGGGNFQVAPHFVNGQELRDWKKVSI